MSRIENTIQELKNASPQVQAIFGVLVFVGLLALYTTAKTLVDGYQITQETKELKEKNQTGSQTVAGIDLKKIVGAPIFGVAEDKQVERVNTTLALLGVMASGDKSVRRAFIAEPGKDATVYYEGDEISKGLVVSKINQDRVTLRRFGAPETLYIAWDQLNSVSKSNNRARPVTSSNQKSTPRRPSAVAKKTPEERKEYLKQMRDRYKGGMNSVLGGKSYKEFIDEGGTREEYMQKVRERFKNFRNSPSRDGGFGRVGPGMGGRGF